MKLSGNKRNGRYVPSSERHQAEPSKKTNKANKEFFEDPRAARAAMRKKRARRTRRILLAVLLIILVIAAVIYGFIKFGVKPPDMKPKPPKPSASSAAEASGNNAVPVSSDRKGNQYTFIIFGMDDGNGNTDTIMVANFDADNYKMNVVNIPRDTLVNVSWNTKKVNTLYSNGGVDGMIAGLSEILGFNVDFYVKVDLKAFEELVDAVGGIDFDVPRDMDYDDPAQNLHIHFKAGPTHLNGQEAMEVMRYRKNSNGGGYPDADIGRIRTQQEFLTTAAAQIINKQNQLNLEEIVSIFLNYVKTDLTAGNLVWLGKEFYKMNSEDITFTTLPANYGDSVNGQSYVTIHLNDWLQVLNAKINPFKEDIAAEDLSILTRDDSGKLYVTNGVWAGKKSWGSGSTSGSSSSGSSTKPSPSPSPSESSKPSPSPSPSETTTPSPSPSETGTPSPSPSPSETPEISPSPSENPEPSPSPSPEPSSEPSSEVDTSESPGVG